MVITASGMICSVGWDTATACAAIRAGLSRPVDIEGFELLDEITSEPSALLGHPISGYTDGFVPPGLWNRLAEGALLDLLETANPPTTDHAFWDECGLVLVTPMVDEERFQVVSSVPPDTIRGTILRYLKTELALSLDPSRTVLICGGHAAGIAAFGHAQELLGLRGVERVLLLALDSYLDPFSLEWLANSDRLRTPDCPVGLAPGEAGAALLLETAASAKRRNAFQQATVAAVATAREGGHFLSGGRQHGVEQARVLEQVVAGRAPFQGQIVSDLNGEEWRAYEIGCAMSRIPGLLHPQHQLLAPFESTGDTGTASTLVATCIAIRSFERHYNPQGQTVVLGASEDGEVAAALLTAV